jgi:hypothetical protein
VTAEVPDNPRAPVVFESTGGLPLSMVLLRQLESPVSARLDPDAFYGTKLRPLSLTIEQIGKTFGPLTEYSHPDQHTEKVRYFNVAKRQLALFRLGLAVLPAGVHTLELVRQAVPGKAVCCLEQIATWLRLSYLEENLVVPFLELYDGTIAPPYVAHGTPYPFPLLHPNGGTLSVRFTLIRECVPDAGYGIQPAFVGPVVAAPNIIPNDVPILSPWDDQRFNWNSGPSSDLYWVVGDRSIIRLFATITITESSWIVEIAGRLSGYNTITGYLKKALGAATERH